jgi:Ca-activated chloride channel family protein
MSDNNINMPDREELADRLIDTALREIVGGQTPPDLSERILTKAETFAPASLATPAGEVVQDKPTVRKYSRFRLLTIAVAATVMIAAGLAILYRTEPTVRETARRSPTTTASKPATATATVANSSGVQTAPGDDVADAAVESQTFHAFTDLGTVPGEAIGERYAQIAPGAAPMAPSPAGATDYFGVELSATPALGSKSGAAAGGAGYFRGGYGVEVPQGEAGEPALTETLAWHDAKQSAESKLLRIEARNASAASDSDAISQMGDQLHDLPQQPRLYNEQGQGPDSGGDKYSRIIENDFKAISSATTDNRLSTFSIDVDTASYANVRQFLLQSGVMPPPDAVRIEELVNYFDYDYSAPTGDVPFASNVEVAGCPWDTGHRLVRVGIKGRELDRTKRPKSNLVFLIDVSGSMDEPNKLPLLIQGMKLLTRELGENDRVAIVVYAGQEGLALASTPGSDQSKILATLDQLTADGSTAGAAGIQLAYKIATENFVKGGVNRVILCTDGDFNVGVTSPAELERMAEERAKETGVFLTVLGFGRGNLNDAMMEQIADKGNGNYHYVDTRQEARKVLVEEMSGTLVTIAKDVKIQVEFNPAKVAGYRLIGYENRVMAAEDFNNDKKDAGEIGAGHTITALYEVVPVGKRVDATQVDDLKYAAKAEADKSEEAKGDDDKEDERDELLTLKIRYKEPDGDKSTKLEIPISDNGQSFAKSTEDFKFASAVASFGMLLRDSRYKGNATYAAVAEIAQSASERDPHGYRKEFVEMVRRGKELSGQ